MNSLKVISTDSKRNIIMHVMFGVLFVVIILNWSVHPPLDYGVYYKTFNNAAQSEKAYATNYLSGITANYENEGGEKRLSWVILASYINGETDSIVKDLNKLILINESCIKEDDLKVFDQIIALRDSLSFPIQNPTGFPFSDTNIVRFRELFDLKTTLLAYLPDDFREVLLYSLRQDVLKARSIYNEYIYSNMHDQTMWFQGFHGYAFFG